MAAWWRSRRRPGLRRRKPWLRNWRYPGANEAGVGLRRMRLAPWYQSAESGRVHGDGSGIGEEETAPGRGGMPVMRWIVFSRAPSAANCFASCMARRCRSPRSAWITFLPPAFQGLGWMNECHGTCQRAGRAQERHQVGARRNRVVSPTWITRDHRSSRLKLRR